MKVGGYLAALLTCALLLSCSTDEDGGPPTSRSATETTAPAEPYALGLRQEIFVDESRPTPVNGEVAERPERTVVTDILYPADGDATSTDPVADAPADRSGGPYPLVVFAHGLGGAFEYSTELLERWASAGYVVAAPRFPLTYAGTAGGLNAGDVEQQPGDVSFVIDQVVAASEADDGPYAGLVDDETIAIAGHSNGGITTMGAIANSCCRDDRVDAALVLAGIDSPYSSGEYDLADTPPVLWVHGTEDEAIGYDAAVRMFNEAVGPKGLLTLEGSGHGEWFGPEDEAFATVVDATTDFFAAYLRDDGAALDRLPDHTEDGVATMRFAAEEGATVTVPTLPRPESHRVATADVTTDLVDGQTVTVTWSGFLPDKTINVVQCTGDGRGGTATCDLLHGHILKPDPAGEGSLPIDVVVGTVGNGVCDADNPCTILVNDSGMPDEDAFVYLPITFADG